MPLPNTAEAGKTSKESVSIEQGQPLRAAEPGQWATKVRAKPIPETPTQRQRDRLSRAQAADERQDTRDSGLDVASFDHADISAEVGNV